MEAEENPHFTRIKEIISMMNQNLIMFIIQINLAGGINLNKEIIIINKKIIIISNKIMINKPTIKIFL